MYRSSIEIGFWREPSTNTVPGARENGVGRYAQSAGGAPGAHQVERLDLGLMRLESEALDLLFGRTGRILRRQTRSHSAPPFGKCGGGEPLTAEEGGGGRGGRGLTFVPW